MSINTEPQWYQNMLNDSTTSYAYDPVRYEFADPQPNTIVLNAGNDEMLKVTEDGFYVRGVKVPQDEHEARAVYECFREWLTWSQLNRSY